MRLSEQWLALAYKGAAAWKSKCFFIEYDDLVAEAMLVLVEAEKTYDPTASASFSTYAARSIAFHFAGLLQARFQAKRDGKSIAFSDLEQPGIAFDELYHDICSADDPFLALIDATDCIIQFYKSRSERERYLLYLKQEEYSSEECRQKYSDFLGKQPEQVNVARDLAKLRKEFGAFRAEGEIDE